MADKKRSRKRKDDYIPPGEEVPDKPSKDEYTVAKWMRKNVPIKRTKFLNHNVEYFTAKRAVDALLESKFCKDENALFKSRNDIIQYLHLMLEHKFYHRARKVPISEQELKARKKDKKKELAESADEDKKDKDKVTDAESSVVEGKDHADKPQKEKRKMKVRLEMHNDQRFVDTLDAYVWIYDPIPFHYWIFGTLLVFGAIGICMFPLWPPVVRLGVYYLSVAAACFLVSIIVLAVIRIILFCLIWLLTCGKHHLWIFPNLTEDVGFFASFWPLYQYEYKGGACGDKKKKKKKKDKDSDAEEDEEEENVENIEDKDGKLERGSSDEDKRQPDGAEEKKPVEEQEGVGSESESESKSSSTGRDFEIVDHKELEEAEK
ncbi:translocation protein SEC62 [Anthonomus grandis grandis]|uniref:translocation protein SEC62 n=1 Tax=Anthonomus grandis grandis TaxID=2921223 RepID=UPI00216511E2|nr:translocation protein SEC62 [Anthonomus grandis grandis]